MVTDKNITTNTEINLRTADRRQASRLHLQIPMFVRGTDSYGEEFIELAKTKPDALTYGSGGPGSISQLVGEWVKSEAKIKVLDVPTRR